VRKAEEIRTPKLKLRKATRKRIHEAHVKHEPVDIPWSYMPEPPLIGHKYAVRGFDIDTRVVVLGKKKVRGRWRAIVKLDHDPVRLLRGLSPVRNENDDLETEPEQVPSRYQRLLDAEGAMKTAMRGRINRDVLRAEQGLVDQRRKGKPGKLAQGQFERAERRRREAA
jgi:hypothetical protein